MVDDARGADEEVQGKDRIAIFTSREVMTVRSSPGLATHSTWRSGGVAGHLAQLHLYPIPRTHDRSLRRGSTGGPIQPQRELDSKGSGSRQRCRPERSCGVSRTTISPSAVTKSKRACSRLTAGAAPEPGAIRRILRGVHVRAEPASDGATCQHLLTQARAASSAPADRLPATGARGPVAVAATFSPGTAAPCAFFAEHHAR